MLLRNWAFTSRENPVLEQGQKELSPLHWKNTKADNLIRLQLSRGRRNGAEQR